MFKNLSIRALTLYITGLLTATNLVFLVLYFWLDQYYPTLWLRIVFILISGVINFYFIRFILDSIVFRKIKLIYKIIRDTKLTSIEKEQVDINSNSLEKVNDEVILWAKNTQEEIENLKSLETYRKNFVGNISHELKTPIFTIQGYLHTLLDGGLYDQRINKKYLDKAAKNTERLQLIVEDLESISKLEQEKAHLDVRSFDIKSLVTEVFEDLTMMAEAKDIMLSFKEGTSRVFMVQGDKEAIRQVLNNLIVNSIKYGKDGGFTKVGFYDMEFQILIEVSDNGLGIDERHLKHLFDRFYRVDQSRNRKMGGSGLGLAIVKHIMEAHKQTINVRSTPDVGSTFGFTLDKSSI